MNSNSGVSLLLSLLLIKQLLGLNTNDVIITGYKGNYQIAVSYCRTRGMNLISVENNNDNMVVYNLAVRYNIGAYWIDANDINSEGVWVNSDNVRLSYTNWGRGEPNNLNGTENCAEGFFFRNQFWNDINCRKILSIICYRKAQGQISHRYTRRSVAVHTEATRARTPYPLLQNTSSSHNTPGLKSNDVIITNARGDFKTAQSYCRTRGMNLIRVENDNDNNLVHNLAVAKHIGDYWIDANDIRRNGTWVNSDNVELTYKNWLSGKPNNESCIEVNHHINKRWRDINCNDILGIICSKKKVLSLSQITVTERREDYKSAVSYCVSQGQCLIRVENDYDNNLVYNLAVSKHIGEYWIDGNGNTVDGIWVNSNNETLKYTKWARGRPINLANNESCAEVNHLGSPFWDDINCQTKVGVICFKKEGLRRSQIVVTSRIESHPAAVAFCKSVGLKLIRVRNELENTLVFDMARERRIQSFWIDGNYIRREGTWLDSDNTPLTYFKWSYGEPSDGRGYENCIEGSLIKNNFWNDIHCYSAVTTICYRNEC